MKAPKKTTPRPRIEISGDRSGERFEAELAAIKRALRGVPFIAAGGCLRYVSVEFEWTIDRRVGELTTRLRPATVAYLRKEIRKRVRFLYLSQKSTSRSLRPHFAELIHRAGLSRWASNCFTWVQCDPDGKIICSSPPLYFGQPRKFGIR